MKTKAAILYELNKPLVIAEIEVPKLKKGQLLVKMLASGICRRQLNEVRGFYGPDYYLPHLLGHEGVGKVVAKGEAVSKVKKDDYVVISWIKSNGLSGSLTKYRCGKNYINAGEVATFSHYAVIAENRLTKISQAVPAGVASILGCAIVTGLGIIRRSLSVTSGSTIAIFGIGGVGSAVLVGAKMAGCKKIIAIDINQNKLKFAASLGATHLVNFNLPPRGRLPLVEYIRHLSSGGVDYAVEATGVKEAMEAAFGVIKDNGKAVLAGNLKKGEKISIDPFDLISGKKIVGTWGGEAKPDEDIPYYVDKYLSGQLPLDKLITGKFKLEDINRALTLLSKKESLGRLIVEF